MAYCPNCGAPVAGPFCGSCGARTSSALGAPPASSGAGLTDNAAAALCYLFGFITGIIFLAWSPYNRSRNVRFHAYQSILLTAAWILLHFALAVLVPFSLTLVLGRIIQLAGLLLWLFLMWKTYNNERIVLPLIGPMAEKQA